YDYLVEIFDTTYPSPFNKCSVSENAVITRFH
ncbi:MAG: hypothetical protein ACI9DS_001344, partial [Glaciecola sp.]